MASKLAPHPPIADATILALLAATADFAAQAPWEYMYDSDVVGLIDPGTGENRVATVLGNAGEVFGAVFYRGESGIRWLLNMLNDTEEGMNLEHIAAMDAVKVEMVPRNQLDKEELRVLKKLNFKPVGRGLVWPKYQSVQPNWPPWFMNQKEAEQLLLDLPRLTAFASFYRENTKLFEDRSPSEIPFLPNPMPNRPLQPEDLDWRPIITAPETFEPFRPTAEQLDGLGKLKRNPKAAYEYANRLLLGSNVLEQGRPCYSRISMLVNHSDGMMLGFQLALAIVPLVENVGNGFVKTLLDSGSLPAKIFIDDERLETLLGPVCQTLNIQLVLSEELVNLDEAMASLNEHMGMAF